MTSGRSPPSDVRRSSFGPAAFPETGGGADLPPSAAFSQKSLDPVFAPATYLLTMLRLWYTADC